MLLTGIVSGGRPVAGSIRVTVASPPFATHTAPSPAAIALGSRPVRATPVTLLVAGSMRDTVASWRLTTHTAPAPTATAIGPFPTPIGATTVRVRGSIRYT